MSKTVKVIYHDDTLETEIIVDGQPFDTSRIKGREIADWAYPFVMRKIKWSGFYQEMSDALGGERAFNLIFEGSPKALAELQEAWEDEPVTVISEESSDADTVMIDYDESALQTIITINNQPFDTSRINGREIADWVYPFMMRKVKWNDIFDELSQVVGSEKYTIQFCGTESALQELKEECPETVTIRENLKKTEDTISETESVQEINQENLVTIRYDETTAQGEIIVNGSTLDVSAVNGRNIADWLSPSGRWKGLFIELSHAVGSEQYKIKFSGSDNAMRFLMQNSPVTVSVEFATVSLLRTKEEMSSSSSKVQKKSETVSYTADAFKQAQPVPASETISYTADAFRKAKEETSSGVVSYTTDAFRSLSSPSSETVQNSSGNRTSGSKFSVGDVVKFKPDAVIYYDAENGRKQTLSELKKKIEWEVKGKCISAYRDEVVLLYLYSRYGTIKAEASVLELVKTANTFQQPQEEDLELATLLREAEEAASSEVISYTADAFRKSASSPVLNPEPEPIQGNDIFADAEDYVLHNEDGAEFLRCQEAANQGDIDEMFNLAYYFENGIGINTPSERKANQIYKEILYNLEMGDDTPYESFLLGQLYAYGKGMDEPDFEKALGYYQKASDAGNAEAQYKIGLIYEEIYEQENQAFSWYLVSAQNGFAPAQYVVAKHYFDFEKKETTWESLKKDDNDLKIYQMWMRKSADNGFAPAQYEVGTWYEFGGGFASFAEENPQTAFNWYLKSAENGYTEAQYRIAECYDFNELGIPEDKEKALYWYMQAAENGHIEALTDVGIFALNGITEPADKEAAVEYFQAAAENGSSRAQFYLAICYENGDGVLQNWNEAFNLLLKSAENGNQFAQLRLGRDYYLYGKVVQPNEQKAFEWVMKAANQGYVDAMNLISEFYAQGIGTKKNMVKSLFWSGKANLS